MSDKSRDAGVLYVLVDRFNTQRLPRALDLKTRIDAGGTLTDLDIHFLEEVFADAKALRPLVEKHPEYQELAGRAMSLYKEILEKAAENEAKAG